MNGRTDERTSRNHYAPHFFKVGGIKINVALSIMAKLKYKHKHVSKCEGKCIESHCLPETLHKKPLLCVLIQTAFMSFK